MCGIWALLGQLQISDFGEWYTAFMKIKHRGPEYSSFDLIHTNALLGFHRLAIMDLSAEGNQPFHYVRDDGSCVYCICNGEIYDFNQLKKKYDIVTKSQSDCEVIIPLYEKFGPEKTFKLLGSEFACIIFDISPLKKVKLYAGRDPIGVRPLFYSIQKDKHICLSSEIKGLTDENSNRDVSVFPPGHYMTYEDGIMSLTPYHNFETNIVESLKSQLCTNTIKTDIRNIFIESVKKRLITEREFGCLLSGGLDSSLVVGVVKYLMPNISFPVFTIAFKSGSTDLPHAQYLAKQLGLKHYVIEIEEDDALKVIDETIYAVESWDITTIRASVMQKLIAKYIKENTSIKVLLVGENSDELFLGYLYAHYAPSVEEAHLDSLRLVKDVHRFDGLRADRCMAYHGLEVRVPFADIELVDYVYQLDPQLVIPKKGIEKYLLRKAFEGQNIIPDDILFRRKEAFSDAVSKKDKSWYKIIQSHIETLISDQEFNDCKSKYPFCQPFTKESHYYRKKFTEYFGNSYQTSQVIPYYWMPKWTEETDDPSARTLKVYNCQFATAPS